MRKRYHKFNHHDGVKRVASEKGKASGKKSRRRRRFLLLSALAALAVLAVSCGFSILSSVGDMLASDITFKDLVSRSALQQTDGRTNVLVLGKGGSNHPGAQLTDTILVTSLRHSDKKAAMLSIPRDLLVNIPGAGSRRINEAYATGWNKEKNKDLKNDAGTRLIGEVVEKVIGAPIHYYATIDFIGFRNLVDKLGGVMVEVEKDFYDPLYPRDSIQGDSYTKTTATVVFSLKAGRQNLDGDTALKYVRSRQTTNDFDRARRQQQVIVAIREKILSLGVLANPIKVKEIIGELGNNVKTSFTFAELKELIELTGRIGQQDVANRVLDNDPRTGLLISSGEGFYHLKPKLGASNFSQIHALFENIFDEHISEELVEVEVFNGAGVTGLGGKLAEKLRAQGLTVSKIETYEKEVERSIIQSSVKGGAALEKVKAYFSNPLTEPLDRKGVVRVIIGKDYVN